MSLCMYVCIPLAPIVIVMKVSMDTPWDPGSVMGQVASAKREAQGSKATENASKAGSPRERIDRRGR